jgi:hypothetical protein
MRDEILELLQLKTIGDKILKKIISFVEIFINGITGN